MGRKVTNPDEIEKRARLAVVRVIIDAVSDNPHVSVPDIIETLGVGFGQVGEKASETLRRIVANGEYHGLIRKRRDCDN